MFDPEIQKKARGSLILNQNDEVAFMYGTDLPFTPQWVSIDVDQAEIFIGAPEDDDHDGQGFKLGSIDKKVYERMMAEKRVLLVCVENGDIRKPKGATWVPLMVSLQDPIEEKAPPESGKKYW